MTKRKTLVVNLVGGPGIGKSSLAAAVYAELKCKEVDCELIREVAKELAWQGALIGRVDELQILAAQHHLQFQLEGKVDVLITDAPLLLKHEYGIEGFDGWHDLVRHLYSQYDNKTFCLTRKKPYNPNGRVQTLTQAKQIDNSLFNMLIDRGYDFKIVPGNSDGVKDIVQEVMEYLQEQKEK